MTWRTLAEMFVVELKIVRIPVRSSVIQGRVLSVRYYLIRSICFLCIFDEFDHFR